MQKLRQNLSIIFIGVSARDSEPFISLLRSSRLAPRAELAEDEATLKTLLGERQWDIVIYGPDSSLGFERLGQLLKSSNKDMPVIMLAPDSNPEHAIVGLKQRASSVVPIDEKELLVLTIRRELYHLENRRRRRQSEFHLQETEKRCRELLQTSTEAIAFLNRENQFIFLNPAFLELTGYDNGSDILGQPVTDLTRDDARVSLAAFIEGYQQDPSVDRDTEVTISRKDDSQFAGSLKFSKSRFERTPCTQVTLQLSEGSTEMEILAEKDLVTGMKNQLFLNRSLEQTVQSAVRADQNANLLYISLDNFSAIKAEVGVNGADAIVRDVAAIIRDTVNQAHVATRYQLDAFTVIYADASSDKARELAEKIRAAVEANLTEAGGSSIQTTCSIGIAAITADSSSAREVLQLAQLAAESVGSKSQRGNGVNVYVREEPEGAEESLSVTRLREAIQQNHLKLLFQPVVSLRGKHEHIYEVLLRLIDKDENEVSPNMFLTMLDHAQVSTELDRWVIAESIRQLASAHTNGNQNRLFINITGRSLEDPGLLQWISEQLKEYDVPGSSLVFQFSESDASSYIKYANIFAQSLAQLHASACIKHYGSSIDSDNVLRHVPAEYVKLDGSFVQELEDSEKHEAFDKLIEPLTAGGKTIVAPLVEGTNVMSKLWKSGIHYIQGFYLQAPRERMDYDFFNDG